MTNDRPIFVVGCPRSGTTLLGLMIHAHPRLAMPPETRFLLPVWRGRRRFGDLQDLEQRRGLVEVIQRSGSAFGDLGLDRGVVAAKIMAEPLTLGSALGIVYREFAQQQGKVRWGDKRPAYFAEVDVLLALFPDAQIVHVLRDGRANLASLKRMSWWPADSVATMAHWSLAEWCMRRDRARLPADVFHVVRYEELVTDPRSVLTGLCTFLGEDFDEAMLRPSSVRDIVPARKAHHSRLDEPVNADAVAAWRDQLEPWEIGLMQTALRRALRRQGYSLVPGGKVPTPRSLWQYAGTSRALRAAAAARWAKEANQLARSTHPVAAQLTSRQLLAAQADQSR